MKSNKGITLVALIITIIVLLILAGVSISLVVGDNGVMNQAQKASRRTDEASAKSALELTLSSITSTFLGDVWEENTSEKIYDNVTIADLDKELQNNGFYIVSFGGTSVNVNTENIDEKVIKDDVDSNGNHTEESNKTEEDYPYVTTDIVIAEGTPGNGDHSNIKEGDTTNSKAKGTTYSTKLKWTATGVTIIGDWEEGSKTGTKKTS